MLDTTHRVEMLPSAQRELAALLRESQKRINKRIRRLTDTPRHPGITVLQMLDNIKKIAIH